MSSARVVTVVLETVNEPAAGIVDCIKPVRSTLIAPLPVARKNTALLYVLYEP